MILLQCTFPILLCISFDVRVVTFQLSFVTWGILPLPQVFSIRTLWLSYQLKLTLVIGPCIIFLIWFWKNFRFNLLTLENCRSVESRIIHGLILFLIQGWLLWMKRINQRYESTDSVLTECFSIKNKTLETCAPLLHPIQSMDVS